MRWLSVASNPFVQPTSLTASRSAPLRRRFLRPRSSSSSPVPVSAAKIACYLWGGICAAVAGICPADEGQQGDPEAGATYELTAIAMVVIGGTSLSGGRGGIGATLLGVLTIGYLDKILSINAVPEASRLMLTGVIVVLAVLAQKSGRS